MRFDFHPLVSCQNEYMLSPLKLPFTHTIKICKRCTSSVFYHQLTRHATVRVITVPISSCWLTQCSYAIQVYVKTASNGISYAWVARGTTTAEFTERTFKTSDISVWRYCRHAYIQRGTESSSMTYLSCSATVPTARQCPPIALHRVRTGIKTALQLIPGITQIRQLTEPFSEPGSGRPAAHRSKRC